MASSKKLFAQEEQAILKTLAYSDIFDFPLTKDELWKFLTGDRKISRWAFSHALENPERAFTKKNGYYCLSGREEIIKRRIMNRPEVKRKKRIAEKAVAYLSRIPTILFLGVSGGLAMGDVEEEDDIDLFIITKKDTLFTTRFFVLCLLSLLGLRRKRAQRFAKDKICTNYLIDETALTMPSSRRDEYTAHEVVQIKPLFQRNQTYRRFLQSNMWVYAFFPHSLGFTREEKEEKESFLRKALIFFIDHMPIERIFRSLQKKLMKQHQTTETVTSHVLIFNPYDYRVRTLQKLRLKNRELGLLTKK